MSPAVRSGKIGLIVAIGVVALLIAGGALVWALNPPFQGASPTDSPTPSASASTSATQTPTATSTAPSATASATPEPTPTGDPVPTDPQFIAAVAPILADANTGLGFVADDLGNSNFTDAVAVVGQLEPDVQRLADNAKPSDPATWSSAVSDYGKALEDLRAALTASDAAAATKALQAGQDAVAALEKLAS